MAGTDGRCWWPRPRALLTPRHPRVGHRWKAAGCGQSRPVRAGHQISVCSADQGVRAPTSPRWQLHRRCDGAAGPKGPGGSCTPAHVRVPVVGGRWDAKPTGEAGIDRIAVHALQMVPMWAPGRGDHQAREARGEPTRLRSTPLGPGALHHRQVGTPDLLIAAVAARTGVTLVHYDSDYDLVASIRGQLTRWAAPRGSLR